MTLQIPFSYPRRGLSGRFNTIRLGRAWSEKCKKGDTVELVDARTKRLLTRATVLAITTGQLQELAPVHAHYAHNWKDHPVAEERSALLIASMKRRYPPNRVRDDSICTVIYLEKLNDPE